MHNLLDDHPWTIDFALFFFNGYPCTILEITISFPSLITSFLF
jgi:hypothetical protein